MTANSDGYYEYLPQGYNSGSQNYPLILFAHGAGELGNVPLSALLGAGLPALINQGQFPVSFTVNGETSSFIVISPHFSKNWPVPTDIQEIIDYLVQHYRVDQNRIYMTGLSMGGGITWDYAGGSSIYANRLAAIVPIAGASWPGFSRGRVITNANLPVWATHNNADQVVPVSNTNNYIANINSAPAPTPLAKKTIFFTVIPGDNHDAWTQTYDPTWRDGVPGGPNIYEWMLQYHRNFNGNQLPAANAGPPQTITLPTNQVTLSGSGSANNGGSIISHTWTKFSGGSATITDSSNYGTTVTGLSAGTYVFRLTVTDNDGATATSDISVIVLSIPYGGTRRTIPGKLEAEDYDNGGQNIAYYDGTTANTGGVYRNSESVDIRTCPDVGNGYCIAWTTDGEWVKYSVNVTTTGTYTFTARIGTPNTGKSIQFQVDGATAGTLVLTNTGGFNNWQTATLNNIPLTAGDHTFRFLFNTGSTTSTNPGFDINWFNFSLAAAQPPAVNAGLPQTIILPISQVTLTGTGTAGNGGTITAHTWIQLSGGSATITDPSNYSTTVTGLSAGTYVFRLTVTQNDNQTVTSDVTITVNPAGPPTANAGTAQTIQLPTSQVTLTGTGTAGNGGTITYAWTRVSGPNSTPPLSIVSPTEANTLVTGLIQGTYVFRLTVTNNEGASATSDVSVIVNPANLSTPYGGTRRTIPGKLEAEDYDIGGQNIAYYDGTTANSGGAYRVSESVDVRTCPDVGNGYCIGWTTDGEWVKYSVNVTTTGTYTFTARIGTPNTGKSIQFQVDGAIAGTLILTNTGGFNNWQTATLNNIPLTAGDHTFRFLFNTGSTTSTNPGFDINWFNFSLAAAQTPTANAGLPQTIILPTSQVTLTGTGTAGNGGTITYAWEQISGPNSTPPLSIVSPTEASSLVTGLIQGTYVFRLTVTNNGGAAATSDVSIIVNPVNLSTPYGGTRRTIPGKLEAEDYDIGGQNTAYYDGTTANSGGAYRVSEYVDVRTCPDVDNGYCIGWTTDGEWVKYSVNVTTTGTYTFTARIGTPNTGKSIQFQVDGVTAGTLIVTNTGGFNNWQTATLNNVSLTAGDHVFRFLFNTGSTTSTNPGFDINWFNFALASSNIVTSNRTIVQQVTDEEILANTSLEIFPNPITDQFALKVSNEQQGNMKLQIFDQDGRSRKEVQLFKNKGASQFYISVADLPKGIYFLRLQMEGWSNSIKMIKL